MLEVEKVRGQLNAVLDRLESCDEKPHGAMERALPSLLLAVEMLYKVVASVSEKKPLFKPRREKHSGGSRVDYRECS